VLSIEQECQTTVERAVGLRPIEGALMSFMRTMTDLAPALPGAGGFFNAYGRVYIDTHNHLELAAIECDSPYVLAQVVDTQYDLVRKAAAKLRHEGIDLLLVNNNHSGLLRPDAAFWGTHENYLIESSAAALADLALPFLVTRAYAGAGGVLSPSAQFLAGVRPLAMRLETGGGTTGNRAIYSTCREEHHQGPSPRRHRLHLIVGDGHRSQFNLALQLGATALALKAIQHDRQLPGDLQAVSLRRSPESWVGVLRRLNKLADPGEYPRVDPSVIAVQRIYLEAARRTVESMPEQQAWISQTLEDWERTLDAYECQDRPWLASRLDAFIKFELFSHYLAEQGRTWPDVVADHEALSELALLDHDYHAISQPSSVFTDLEERRLIDHRVAPPVTAGDEEEPFVPDVGTRARARARFIKEHARNVGLVMSWDYVREVRGHRVRKLYDPFAVGYVG
jgi:hypothetical protein